MKVVANCSNISDLYKKVIKGEMTLEEYRKAKIISKMVLLVIKDSKDSII